MEFQILRWRKVQLAPGPLSSVRKSFCRHVHLGRILHCCEGFDCCRNQARDNATSACHQRNRRACDFHPITQPFYQRFHVIPTTNLPEDVFCPVTPIWLAITKPSSSPCVPVWHANHESIGTQCAKSAANVSARANFHNGVFPCDHPARRPCSVFPCDHPARRSCAIFPRNHQSCSVFSCDHPAR